MDSIDDENWSSGKLDDALAAREEALLRANAALDSALPDVVQDVDSLLERHRRDELAFAGNQRGWRAEDVEAPVVTRGDTAVARLAAAAPTATLATGAAARVAAPSRENRTPKEGKTRWRSARVADDEEEEEEEEEEQSLDDEALAAMAAQRSSPPPSPDDDDGKMGSEAAVRYRKARVAALQLKVKESAGKVQALERRAHAAESSLEKSEQSNKTLRREVASLRQTAEKEATLKTEAETTTKALGQKLQATDRALRDIKKEASQIGSEHRAGDVRLARAVETADKLKAQLERDRASSREALDEARKSRDKLQNTLRKAERQKVELLNAFRKQLKLIDVLKRQKIHMEAARLLAFTEDEFIKVVSWDGGGAGGDKKNTGSNNKPPPSSRLSA